MIQTKTELGLRTVLLVLVICGLTERAWAQTGNPIGSRWGAPSTLTTGNVLGEVRATQGDLVIMTNGDRLSGTVRNERFRLRTPYAQVTMEANRVAGLSLNVEPNGRAAIVSVVGDRFTGYADEGPILLDGTSGTKLRLESRLVRKVIFAKRDRELTEAATNDLFTAGNSDAFFGRLVDPSFTMTTPYAVLPVRADKLESLFMAGRYGGRAYARNWDGEMVSGHMTPTQFDVDLDIGGRITINTRTVGSTTIHRKQVSTE